jgi:hypothetical protein
MYRIEPVKQPREPITAADFRECCKHFILLICAFPLCLAAPFVSCVRSQGPTGTAPAHSDGQQITVNGLPADAAEALSHPESTILYSLDPLRSSTPEYQNAPRFYGWRIRFQVAVSGERAALATKAVKDAVSPFAPRANCFEPRHGLRVTSSGHTYDFVICYQCKHMAVTRDGEEIADPAISGDPGTLDRLL